MTMTIYTREGVPPMTTETYERQRDRLLSLYAKVEARRDRMVEASEKIQDPAAYFSRINGCYDDLDALRDQLDLLDTEYLQALAPYRDVLLLSF